MEKLSNWMIILGRKVVPASAGSAFFFTRKTGDPR